MKLFIGCLKPVANAKVMQGEPELVTFRIKVAKDGYLQCKIRPVGAKKGMAKRLERYVTKPMQKKARKVSDRMQKIVAAKKLRKGVRQPRSIRSPAARVARAADVEQAMQVGDLVVTVRLTSEVEVSKDGSRGHRGRRGKASKHSSFKRLLGWSRKSLRGLRLQMKGLLK